MASLAGLYIVWFRDAVGDLAQHLGLTLDAVLILAFASLALRTAVARDFTAHRRWALRLFVAASAVWFFRIGLMLWMVVFREPVGFDGKTFTGPFLTALSFADYALPLAGLELYFWAQSRAAARPRLAVAALITLLSVVMSAGIVAATAGMWVPVIKQAYDPRVPIGDTLLAIIDARGIEAAVAEYRHLKAQAASSYNFDQTELNTLGYRLLRTHRVEAAVRIFQLNTEAFPNAGNVYDSLGEAYLAADDRALAIANYRKSLRLDPGNRNAVATLRQLGAP